MLTHFFWLTADYRQIEVTEPLGVAEDVDLHDLPSALVVNAELEDVWEDRVRVMWRERPLVVVSRAGLATMKRIAGRKQDLADLAKLEGTEDEET